MVAFPGSYDRHVRTIDEFKLRKLDGLKHMIKRPQMWALDGRAMQTLAQGALHDLCFIDEREAEYSEHRDELTRYGKLGVAGAFGAVFGDGCTYVAEVASVFSHIGARLGYVELDRRLSELEWRSLLSTVRTRYEEVDVRRSAVLEDLGEPSLIVGTRVLCYAGPALDEWASFDCWEETVTRYVIEGDGLRGNFRAEREDDPLLRNVRVPAPSFNESLIMTTYGKVLRWGPGWWLRTDGSRPSGTPDGVREQLQGIDACDPSQALGPRRP